jgi:Fic family protein
MNIENFLRESNYIEGEVEAGTGKGQLYLYDKLAATSFLARPLTAESLKELHHAISHGRDIKRGEWRDVDVRVGSHKCPDHQDVERLMAEFFENIHYMNAWKAHVEFEKIHPFEDLNGRTGRLLWLHKMKGVCKLSFLQSFYYQTLSNN